MGWCDYMKPLFTSISLSTGKVVSFVSSSAGRGLRNQPGAAVWAAEIRGSGEMPQHSTAQVHPQLQSAWPRVLPGVKTFLEEYWPCWLWSTRCGVAIMAAWIVQIQLLLDLARKQNSSSGRAPTTPQFCFMQFWKTKWLLWNWRSSTHWGNEIPC